MSVVVTEPVTHGAVLVKTSLGDISVELFAREAPKACRNFVQLCLEGYYDGLPFHRIVPNFIAQTGDDSGTGAGGESIYDEGEFEDEFSQRLRFTRRGLVAMANQGRRNSNMSQFFFTLDRADELNNKNTIFGRVAAGDTLFNVLKLNEVELEPGTDRPVYPPKIKSVEVVDNPFEDIVPRITAKERKEQDRAKREMKVERAKQRELGKRKGTKNKALLSFGAEPEEPVDAKLAKAKLKSAHDVLEDERLSKQVLDDRGTSATLPPGMEGPSLKRKADPPTRQADDAKKSRSSTSAPTLTRVRDDQAKTATSAADKVRDEIAKVQQDLKKMSKAAHGSDEEEGTTKKGKKAKRTGPSLLQLERAKYSSAAPKSKSKSRDDDTSDVLDSFRAKLFQAQAEDPRTDAPESAREPSAAELALGIKQDEDEDDEDDAGWMTHALKFRKDVTLDLHKADEYELIDPLAKSSKSLDELSKEDPKRRLYPGERDGSSRGKRPQKGEERSNRRPGDRGPPRDDRRAPGAGGRDQGRDSRDHRDSGRDRPEVRGNWKQDRVATTDLA